MISQSQIDYFKEVGIWYTGVPSLDPATHLSCLRTFLAREEAYKSKFLQTRLNSLFEGYSYMGQEDSSNQYADDRLFTYVLSDFFDSSRHAPEFQPLLEEQQVLIPQIRQLERALLEVTVPELLDFYDHQVAHSLSANFYPSGGEEALRLTAHPDGSLLTVFPFGMDQEFQFERPDGSWHSVEKTDEIVCFSGYLMECMTPMKSLNHKVEKLGVQSERFSFAYFSIPKPDAVFDMKGKKVTSEEYFARYLSLFE